MDLMLTADGGPAVSGAMDAIVVTYAGKDLISSLASGLSSRFGAGFLVLDTRLDIHVELVKEYVRKHFPSHSLLDYALAVEKVTTAKKDTLIVNVDGCIAVCFVDLLRDSGAFTPDEVDKYIINGLFVFGCSIGFTGHHLAEKRLRVPLYRHPADDIWWMSVNPGSWLEDNDQNLHCCPSHAAPHPSSWSL